MIVRNSQEETQTKPNQSPLANKPLNLMHGCYFSLVLSVFTSQTYRHLTLKSSCDVLIAQINSNPLHLSLF